MHDTYRRFAITMGDAIKNSLATREKVARALNEGNSNPVEGIVALLVLAAGHAKEYELGRGEFLYMCESLYDSIHMNKEGTEDVILMPENQNN